MFGLILFDIRWIYNLISSGTGIVYYVNIFYDYWFPRGSLTHLRDQSLKRIFSCTICIRE